MPCWFARAIEQNVPTIIRGASSSPLLGPILVNRMNEYDIVLQNENNFDTISHARLIMHCKAQFLTFQSISDDSISGENVTISISRLKDDRKRLFVAKTNGVMASR